MDINDIPKELVIKTIQQYVMSKGVSGKVYAYRVSGVHIWFNIEGISGKQVDLIGNIFRGFDV